MNANEMKERLIKESFSSKVLKYHEPAEGSVLFYEKDIDTLVFAVAEKDNKIIIEGEQKSNRVFPFPFTIKVEADTEEEAFNKLLGYENHLCLELLLKACNSGYTIYTGKEYSNIMSYTGDGCGDSIGKEELERLVYLVERNRLKVDNLLIGSSAAININYNLNIDDSKTVNDSNTLPIKSLWGYNLYEIDTILPVIFAVTASRYIGGRTIKHFSITKTTNDNKEIYSITVEGTMCLLNIRGVAALVDESYVLPKINESELNKLLEKEKKDLYKIN